MNAVAPHPYDLIGAELRALAQQEGQDLWRNRSRLMGLLLDHQPELRREIRSIVSGVEQGVARALSEADRNLAAITIDRQASLMETEVGLRPEVAQNVTRAIAHALDLGPLPSVYASGRPAPPDQPHAPPFAPAPHPHPAWSDPTSSQRLPLPGPTPIPAGSRPFPWPVAMLGTAVAAAAAIVLVPQLQSGPTDRDRDRTGIEERTRDKEARTDAADTDRARPAQGFGQELQDFGIAAQSTLRADVGGPTPLDIPVGRRITTDELRALIARDRQVLLIDVLAGPHPGTLRDAHYAPVGGLPGSLDDAAQTSFKEVLDDLTGSDFSRPLVFFCAGASCWESYNATLRAAAIGYTNLYWYRGGLFSWQEARLPMQTLPRAAGGDE